MENIIKTNVTDCILDKKRSVVEISTKGNQAGKELVEILRANIPSELIKDIRYTFGTRDIEVVTHSPAGAEELYKLITGILDNKISHSVLTDILGSAVNFGTTVLGGKQQASVDKEKAKLDAETAVAQASLDAQVRALESKNKVLYFGIGGALLIVAAIIFIVLKK